jgi:hypothetical protein
MNYTAEDWIAVAIATVVMVVGLVGILGLIYLFFKSYDDPDYRRIERRRRR